jgi:hypothetical protein
MQPIMRGSFMDPDNCTSHALWLLVTQALGRRGREGELNMSDEVRKIPFFVFLGPFFRSVCIYL